MSTDGQTTVILDSASDVYLNGDIYSSTVRVVTCEMLVPSGKCRACVSYHPLCVKCTTDG